MEKSFFWAETYFPEVSTIMIALTMYQALYQLLYNSPPTQVPQKKSNGGDSLGLGTKKQFLTGRRKEDPSWDQKA